MRSHWHPLFDYVSLNYLSLSLGDAVNFFFQVHKTMCTVKWQSLLYQLWVEESHIQAYKMSLCVLISWIRLGLSNVFWYCSYWNNFCCLPGKDSGSVLASLQGWYHLKGTVVSCGKSCGGLLLYTYLLCQYSHRLTLAFTCIGKWKKLLFNQILLSLCIYILFVVWFCFFFFFPLILSKLS